MRLHTAPLPFTYCRLSPFVSHSRERQHSGHLLTPRGHSWDDWVPQDRLRKLTDDNKELAANLRRELTQQLQPKSAPKPTATSKTRKQGSEFGSGRGSEERHSSVPAGGRGTKRGRDNDIEKVRLATSLPYYYLPPQPFAKTLAFPDFWTSDDRHLYNYYCLDYPRLLALPKHVKSSIQL